MIDVDKIHESIAEHGDFTMYYYLDKGDIHSDVHISSKGVYINSKNKTVHPKRCNASEVIKLNEELQKEKERIKKAQVKIEF